MDPNTFQNIAGTAYVQNLQSQVRSHEPFADYDALTPDEPSPVWQVAKSLFNSLRSGLASQQRETEQYASDTSSLPLTNQPAESR